jgi:hypothetical protein
MASMSLAFLVFAFAQAAAPPAQPAAQPAAPAIQPGEPAPDDCAAERPSADSRRITICAQRPNGYRLNPDIMEARRELKSGGRPTRPGATVRPDCAAVGPAPCTIGGINLIGAALTAAEMAERAVKGQDVGKMFVTDPHPDEYHLYLMAKARREAEEAEKAAAKKPAGPAGAQPAAPTAEPGGK